MNPPKTEPTDEQEIKVQLKPILGIAPKYYLAVIYGIVLAVVLYYLLLNEGISHPGTRLSVVSTPPGASIVYEDHLYGYTPADVFLPQGEGKIVVSKPGFVDFSQGYVSSNQIFLSQFFPKSDSLNVQLKPESDASVPNFAAKQISLWSRAAPFNEAKLRFVERPFQYQFPPLFTQFVTDAKAIGWNDDSIFEFLKQQRRYVVDPQMYLDFGRACGLWTDSIPESLEIQYGQWEKFLGSDQTGNGRLLLWILANQPKVVRDNLISTQTAFMKSTLSTWQASLPVKNPTVGTSGSSLSSAGTNYVSIPSGTYRWGFGSFADNSSSIPTEPPYSAPVQADIASFWLADSEVTNAQFAAFLDANPTWSPAQKQTLISQGWANEDYLAHWPNSNASSPVTEISWYAAQAYVDWLNASGKVPSGKVAILPTEYQWEWAAREAKIDKIPAYKKGQANALGLKAMQDGVWEWTASSWAPADQLVVSTVPAKEPKYAPALRTAKGGSSETDGKVGVWERAGIDAQTATASLGFRVALVPHE